MRFGSMMAKHLHGAHYAALLRPTKPFAFRPCGLKRSLGTWSFCCFIDFRFVRKVVHRRNEAARGIFCFCQHSSIRHLPTESQGLSLCDVQEKHVSCQHVMETGLAVRSSVQSTSSAGSRRSQSPADRVRFC